MLFRILFGTLTTEILKKLQQCGWSTVATSLVFEQAKHLAFWRDLAFDCDAIRTKRWSLYTR